MPDGPETEASARLCSLEAYLLHLGGDSELALEKLANRIDPDAIRRRLVILLDTGRLQDAADLLRGRALHVAWCDVAVRALIRAGDVAQALDVIEWAGRNADRVAAHRCAVLFAMESLNLMFSQRVASQAESGLSDEERQTCERVISVLSPILAFTGSRIENELECRATEAAFIAHQHLRNQGEVDRLGNVLATRRPIPIVLAEAVFRDRVAAPVGLLDRLRAEYPDDVGAQIWAIAIEGMTPQGAGEAFIRAKTLAPQISAAEDQDRLATVIIDIAQRITNPRNRQEAERLGESLLHDERYRRFLQADQSLKCGALGAAGVVLDELRDEKDPVWLQLQGSRLLQEGRGIEAAEHLLRAGKQMDEPDTLKKAASVAFENGALDMALSALESLVELRPKEAMAYRYIAGIRVEQADFAGAAEQFRRLAEQGELDDTDRYNWARCLARAGNTGESRQVIEEFADPATIPLPACLLRADILSIEESPAAAFESLRQVRQRFWQEPGFLQTWITLGFKSSNEAEGHEALVQLQVLQAEGRARGAFLKAVSIDEIAAHIEDRAEKHREAHREMVRGRLSWLVVDTAFGEPPYWGWRLRTQELRWLADEPVERARFTTYATNGFRVGTRQDLGWLERIECPPRGTSVVADLSALISLHRLGLLGAAADYFGRVLIPAAYLQNLLEEAGRLLPHQSSRLQAANTIWEAISTGRVSVTDDPSVQRLSEYERIGEESPPMRLRDVLDVLHQTGRLPDARYRDLLRRAHQPATGGPRAGHTLVVELETLRTLTDAGVLGDVVQAFQVGITSDDRAQLQGEIAAFEAQANVRRWHADLWRTVRADSRFVQAIDSPVSERESEEPGPLARIPLVGVLLARDREVPLLADDRCCQMIAINERPLDETAAFGTDALLDALIAEGVIDAETAADAYLQLMAWRYRFIIVPPEVLVALAARYSDHPPGQALRDVAAYVHDSMRDAGLFGGPERTDPPVSMAQKLFMHWTSTISEFLALLWRDPDWPEDRLKATTSWAVVELYPSVPRNSELGRRGMDGMWNRHVLSHFLIAVGRGSDAARANAGVRALASELALSEDEYLRILTGVVDEA